MGSLGYGWPASVPEAFAAGVCNGLRPFEGATELRQKAFGTLYEDVLSVGYGVSQRLYLSHTMRLALAYTERNAVPSVQLDNGRRLLHSRGAQSTGSQEI